MSDGRDIRPRHIEHNSDQAAGVVRVQLTSSLSAGASATALLVSYSPTGDSGTVSDASNFIAGDEVITVFDPFGNISGNIGDRFWAVYRRDSESFELLFQTC
jgi:hypothetical protein